MTDCPRDPIKDLFQHVEHLSVLQDLTTALPYLSSAEIILVEYLLQHPSDVASMSAAEVAGHAGVSEATLYRLCRQLGIGGYAPLKDRVREVGMRYAPSFVDPIDVRKKDDPELSPLQWATYFGMRSLLDASSVDEGALNRAVDAIISSQRVNVSGVGFLSAGLAQMTAVALQRMGRTCMLWTDHHSMRVEETIFGPEDVVVAISHSGESTTLVEFVSAANKAGATVIAIANYGKSSIASRAQIKLTTSVRERTTEVGDLLPRVAQLLVLEVLIGMIRDRLWEGA